MTGRSGERSRGDEGREEIRARKRKCGRERERERKE